MKITPNELSANDTILDCTPKAVSEIIGPLGPTPHRYGLVHIRCF